MSYQRYADRLHVKSIFNLRLFMYIEIFHDLANFTRTYHRNRVFTVKLSVIPIHFGQSENLLTNYIRRGIALNNADFKWLRDIRSWVSSVVLYRSFRVK